jgi:glycosyltransferase involved in cell wall biosynthesis
MSRQRLLIVRPTLGAGGADRVTLTLLEHLDRSSFSLTLALIRRRGELLAEIPADVEVVALDAGGIFSAALPLRRLIRERRPDIVFSTSSGTNITAALATPRPGPRLVLSERSGLIREHRPVKKWTLFAAKRLLYRRADCVTAVSRGVAGDLAARLKLAPNILQVVYNPVVTPELAELARAPLREDWLAGPAPVLLAAGRLTRVKGFDVLLEAVAALRRDCDCRLIILGEGPLRAALERQARSLGIADAVKLPGFVTNPYAYMSRATVFVLSSHFEGLPGALIQAMACGAAVVATRCPFGPDEIVTDGVDGMLVPPGNGGDLARALRTLLADEPRRLAMARAGRESALRFSLQRIMPNYHRALDPDAT